MICMAKWKIKAVYSVENYAEQMQFFQSTINVD